MKRLKSSLFVLAAFVLILFGTQIVSAAETGVTGDGFNWTYEDGIMAITDYTGDATAVNIPSKINGKAVTMLSDNVFQYYSSLTSVTIPNSVTSFGEYVFSRCEGLKSVVIPGSVTKINTGVFFGCTGLTSITIPDSVTSLGSYAFNECKGLTSVTLSKSITSIGFHAFYNCNKLTSVTIPKSVTTIYDKAFGYYEESGQKKKIPGFTIHGYYGTAAEEYAKENSLTFVGIQSGNEKESEEKSEPEAKPSAAAGTVFTVSGHKYKVNGDLTSVIYDGYEKKTASKVSIPAAVTFNGVTYKVTSIKNSAFKNNKKLKTLTVGSNVKSIGASAFQNCTALKTVTVGKNVTSIDKNVFSGCKALTKITFKGNKIKKIGTKAFYKAGSKNYKKLQVIVPKAKYQAYQKMLLKVKLSKKAKIIKK